MAGRIKLEGKTFRDFKVIKYVGGKKYICKCNICGEEKELYGSNIKNEIGVNCTYKKEDIVDITDKYIGDWHVLQYSGNKKYICQCSCGNIKEVLKANLINGSSKSCGHKTNRYGDLTGQVFGEWKVLCKEGYNWKCECSCGNIRNIGSSDLMKGKTKSCGHGYNTFYDITKKQFGNWKVIEYVGKQLYKCECQCENKTIKLVRKSDLLSGATTSCGCNRALNIKNTLISRYNEIAPNKVHNPRTIEQIEATVSKENMLNFIDNLGYKPSSIQLSDELGIKLHRTLTLVHKFELEDYIHIQPNQSSAEIEICNIINSLGLTLLISDRSILKGKELDIYIPSKNIAIEYNGVYWHSSALKSKKYHQDKTIDCAKNKIRLLHIFEYEWINNKEGIINLLNNTFSNDKNIIYGRKCCVRNINNNIACRFLDKYHLQKSVNSSINIGLFLGNELISVMSFGKPRFNTAFDYELIRYCTKNNYSVVGGAEKLFSYFIKNYNPQSIITYVDISKFTGNIYTRLGFKPIQPNPITEPNYVWYNASSNILLTRYQTQKHKLIEQGLGTEDQTEDEIMINAGYLKIYDSGNLKLEWNK